MRLLTRQQVIRLLGVDDQHLDDLQDAGILSPAGEFRRAGTELYNYNDVILARNILERDRDQPPALIISGLAARLARVEHRLRTLAEYIQPPVQVSLQGLSDDQLRQLVVSAAEARDRRAFSRAEIKHWAEIIAGLDDGVLDEIQRAAGINHVWRLFADLLRHMATTNPDDEPLLAAARRNLRDTLLLRQGLDTTRFLDAHPRQVLANSLTGVRK